MSRKHFKGFFFVDNIKRLDQMDVYDFGVDCNAIAFDDILEFQTFRSI